MFGYKNHNSSFVDNILWELCQQLGHATRCHGCARAADKKLKIILENYHLYDKNINPISGMLNEFVARCEILTDWDDAALDNGSGNVIIYLSHS